MTEVTTDIVSEQEREDQLWTDYMVALARKQENWRLHYEAWHDFVLVGLRSDTPEAATHHEVSALFDTFAEAERAAYAKWKECAYPLHGIHQIGE